MKPAPFEYFRPETLEEALALLAEHEDAKPLAGGQSLIPAMNFRLARPSVLVDLEQCVPAGVRREDGHVVVGAMTRQYDLEVSAECPPLVREALMYVGHLATRCRGTVGGSLVHADPTAELPVCAVALGAELVVRGVGGERVVPAEEFFQFVYTTALQPGELLVEIRWPDAQRVAFEEYAHRHGDFAVVCVAVAGERVAIGGVAPTPVLLDSVDALEPFDTPDAPAEYKREVARALVERARERAA